MRQFPPAAGTHRHRIHAAIAGAAPAIEGATEEAEAARRWLAGVAASGARDGARVLALMSDPSRRVRGVAICAAAIACDDAQAADALYAAWQVRGERRLLRRMARAKRVAAIDAFLDRLAAERHLRELVDDLSFGSLACVRRHLAHALERPSDRFWRGLATGHPALLGELLLARWRAATSEADPVTRQLTAAHAQRIADRAPDAGLALADLLLARGIEPDERVLRALLRERPEATVALAIRHAARVPYGALGHRLATRAPALLAQAMAHDPALLGAFGPEVRTLSADRCAALAASWCAVADRFPVHGKYLLAHLPVDEARERAYLAWSLAARDRDGVIDPGDLAALPVDLAAREAARHLEVVALSIDPARRLARRARYLPWAALEVAVRDQLGHPDGVLRALALGELLAHPGAYPDDEALPARALALITARKFEQDPVRAVMIEALAAWPRRIWRAAHLPVVAQVLRDGLDASDLSVRTATAMQQLIARLFGVDPAWASTWLATTIAERGALYAPNLGAKLTDDDLRVAAPHLLAIARTWATQERLSWLQSFATGLGPRLGLVDGLAELVAQVRDEAPWDWAASQLTELLARWAPEVHARTFPAALAHWQRRNWRAPIVSVAAVEGLVGAARSRKRARRRPVLSAPLADALAKIALGADVPEVPSALAMLRQRAPATFDGLLPVLLASDESAIVVGDVRRWVDRHRQDLLDRYFEPRPVRGRWSTAKSRWVVAFGEGYFRWTPAQCEAHAAALDAIVGDAARDIPAVLVALATWPELTWAAPTRLIARATDERPAVREKALRVMARCDAGQAVPTLLACLEDDRARFAIYGLRRALFAMQPARALALLEGVPMRKLTVAKEAVRLTGELRAAGAFARLDALSRTQLHRDLRIALLRALWDHLDRDATWAIFARAVADPDWVLASRLADIPADRLTPDLDDRLSGLLAQLLARPEPEARIALLQRTQALGLVDRKRDVLAAILARLASPTDAETTAAMTGVLARATEADLPAVRAAVQVLARDPRAFHATGNVMSLHYLRSRASWRAITAEIVAATIADPRLTPIALAMAARRAIAADYVATLEAAPLDADAITAAIAGLAALHPSELGATVATLAASARPEVRRIAVAALALDAAPARGWTDERLDRLRALRADPSSLVAGAAARLWPPREQDPQ